MKLYCLNSDFEKLFFEIVYTYGVYHWASKNRNNFENTFDKIYDLKYSKENKDVVRKDFIFTLGLLLLFSTNQEREYYLNEHQLFQILPDKYSRFIEDLYSLKIRNPISGIHIDERDNNDDDLELLCKFNLGVKAQLELLKEDVLNGHDEDLTKLNRELQHLKIKYDFDWKPY